jgi:hypothetical protein
MVRQAWRRTAASYRLGAAARENRDAAPKHDIAHDLAVRVVPQEEADLIMERVHCFLAVAPGGHAIMEAPQHLLAVFLDRDRLEECLFEIAGLGRPVVLVVIRTVDPAIAFPFADEWRQRPQLPRIGDLVRHR